MRWTSKAKAWSISLLALCALLSCLALPGCGKSTSLSDSSESSALEVVKPVEVDPVGSSSDRSATGSDSSAQSGEVAASESATSSDVCSTKTTDEQSIQPTIDEDGTYTSKDEVAWYLHTYGHLPSNYITKSEAEDAGWRTGGKSLAQACPGKSIGGDKFSNREGLLPKAKGRQWYECDIDYAGEKSRNAKRILYSNDGLIYYTEDHYKTYERLY